ncbi:hypothetical protein L6Q79_14840 [bacterium]|nr:hypothetical protein [bacterium]MCK6543947.1 hypothetical protein [bacterium]NUN46309.1 hypothetical protein [bacterium]
MKFFFGFFIVWVFYGCAGCSEDKKKPYDGRLDKDYDLIIAHAVPDEDRKYPIEVFVGRLLAVYPDSTDAANLLDFTMQIQLRAYVEDYRGVLTYHDDAKVYMTAGGATVELEHVGKGTYRDVANALHISALEVCSLRVTRPHGKEYKATVRVPDNITITIPLSGDTITVYPKKQTPVSPLCAASASMSGPEVSGAYIYRFRTPYPLDPNDQDLVFLQSKNKSGLAAQRNECVPGDVYDVIPWYVSMAMDTILTRAWGMRETTGFAYDLFDSLTYWRYNAPITYRSNITDEDGRKIAGYFGAYTLSDTISFVIEMKPDSCTCD